MELTSYTIERDYPVPADRLFQAFVDPKDLEVWVWAGPKPDLVATVDLRVGGTYAITGFRGIVVDVVPHRRLVHTVHWDADVGYESIDEVLVIDVEEAGEGCRLRYTHLGIPDDGQSAAEHERSVRITLDYLEKYLTG